MLDCDWNRNLSWCATSNRSRRVPASAVQAWPLHRPTASAMIGAVELHETTRTGLLARTWTSAEFETSKGAWDQLLALSDADPLFMSWDWQWRWWKHHAYYLDATLHL